MGLPGTGATGMTMTAREAAQFAGCSVSTLRRYECAWCDQSCLYMLTSGCGAIWEKCDPLKDWAWPPTAREVAHA